MLLSLIICAFMASADDLPRPGDPAPPNPTSVPFDFNQEGIYSIQASCLPHPQDCNSEMMKMLNRLSIVDTHSQLGVWVMLASTSPGDMIDAFYLAQIGPTSTQVTAAPRSGSHTGVFSYLNFTIDPLTGNLSGTLYDFESAGHMVITGKAISRVGDIVGHGPRGTPAATFALGNYKGTMAGIPGVLSVHITPAARLYGNFGSDSKFDGQSVFKISFDSGTWDPINGLLQLTFENPRFFGEGELNLVIQPDKSFQSIYVDGFVNGTSAFIKMEDELS